MRFENKVAVVTGAASGIGEATAHRLAAEGAAVVVADVDLAGAEAVAKAITEAGATATPAAVDVTSRADIEALLASAEDAHGPVDVLVNNAGIGSIMPVAMVDEQTIDRLLAVNVKGVLHGVAIAAPRMMERGGAIVNTASAAALIGMPMQVLYSATKGAVVAMTRAAAMEFAPKVRINCVCPGGVSTRFVETVAGAEMARVIESAGETAHPLGRMGRSEEIAAAIAYLASEEAAFVTGASLVIDGGMTAGQTLELA